MTPGFVAPLLVGPERLATGAARGPLAGATVAVKDVIDVAGLATGAGNPDFLADATPAAEHAAAVTRLLAAGAEVIGKAITDELAYSLSGTNAHYGTPRNPAAPGRTAGGSSSGPASAVALGVADLGLGTDTGGSIRVPASYCGIFGLRPTHGRVPLTGVVALAPSYDTCGLLAADGELLARGALALLTRLGPGEPPTRLVLAADLLELADPAVGEAVRAAAHDLARRLGCPIAEARPAAERVMGWRDAFQARQRVEAWAVHGAWITARRPRMGPDVAARFAAARAARAQDAAAADTARREALDALATLPSGAALVLPSAATVAPEPDLPASDVEDLRGRTLALTCLAGLTGAPAVSLPLAEAQRLPAGVCLLARPGEDERLLAAAAAVCCDPPIGYHARRDQLRINERIRHG